MSKERIRQVVELLYKCRGVDSLVMERKIPGQQIFAPHPIENVLSALPEFQDKPKEEWIKPSERLPKQDTAVYVVVQYDKNDNIVYSGGERDVIAAFFEDGVFSTINEPVCPELVERWQKRHAPAPPVEEDSPCIKELREYAKMNSPAHEYAVNGTIEIVKRHEAAQKEKK